SAFTFTVTLTPLSGVAAGFSYVTTDGSALAGADYLTASGTLTIAAGLTQTTLTILVLGDTAYEANETFSVQLLGATNAQIGTGQGQGTILNDDPLPRLRVADAAVTEGAGGT